MMKSDTKIYPIPQRNTLKTEAAQPFASGESTSIGMNGCGKKV